MSLQKKIEFIADHYGYDAQARQLMEECAEMIQALNKEWRVRQLLQRFAASPSDVAIESDAYYTAITNVLSELADVDIVMREIKHFLFPRYKEQYDQILRYKIKRQIKRIGPKGKSKTKRNTIQDAIDSLKYKHS